MGLIPGTVKLDKYDAKWKEDFLKEKEELAILFGDIALAIEHIGSTSIEGLTSKPIIDIAVGLKRLIEFDSVKEKFLEKENYIIKEDSTPGEILVKKGIEPSITHFIHVMEIDDERYIESILFRDYLRNNIDAINEYENLKLELAAKYPNERPKYTAGKNDFIKGIISKAKGN